jgi:hypothetical protein
MKTNKVKTTFLLWLMGMLVISTSQAQTLAPPQNLSYTV